MKIALLADIHSNLEALKSVLADIKKQNIKKILNSGDIVGYNCSPNEVIELIKKEKILSVRGNHDATSINLKKDFRLFNEYARAALVWTHQHLSTESKKFLNSLDEIGEGRLANKNVVIIHGSSTNHLWDYVFPDTADSILLSSLNKSKADILVLGHTHFPFAKNLGNRLVINPGSVGQPRNNQNNANYAVLDLETLKVELKKIPYNIDSEAQKIISEKLPRYLADRLYVGR